VSDERRAASVDRGYLLDNEAQEAEQRFDSLGALFNPITVANLERVGIDAGWRCWEVGVGGPSIPTWLSARVGPSGHVLATDIDPRWVASTIGDNVEVRRHDVAADEPPGVDLDLAHARLVLLHVPGRDRALSNMVAAVRPGGWVVIEDFDTAMQPCASPDDHGAPQHLANKVRSGFLGLLEQRGADLAWGRTLPRRLRDHGLVDVAAEAYLPFALPAGTELEKANVRQTRGAMVEAGFVTETEVDEYLALLDTGTMDVTPSLLISCWGRKPTG
jgi:SAM-dependent methyltransferase